MEGWGQGGRHLIASGGILIIAISAGLLALADEPERPAKPFTREQLQLYEAEVKPILTKHCLKCHGGGPKIRGGFRLDSREAVLRGGDLGPAALPGDPAQSLLVKAINYRRARDAALGQIAGARDRGAHALGQGRPAVDAGFADDFSAGLLIAPKTRRQTFARPSPRRLMAGRFVR